MGQARLLDKMSSIWARPICLIRNQVNGNGAHLLDKIPGEADWITLGESHTQTEVAAWY